MSDANYNLSAAELRNNLIARSVIVLVIDGKHGTGIGIDLNHQDASVIPHMLRQMAKDLEEGGTACPKCGFVVNMHVGENKPAPGAFCICLNCAEVSVFDGDLKLAKLSEDEMADKLSPKALKAVNRAQLHLKTKPGNN